MKDFVVLLGRIGLALIFVLAGWDKLQNYDATAQYMASTGVPGGLLPLVILAELGGGLAILTGTLTLWAGLGLALFSLVTAFLFHHVPGDQNQSIHFMKNIAMAGGLLVLAAQGPGAYSVDARRSKRRR